MEFRGTKTRSKEPTFSGLELNQPAFALNPVGESLHRTATRNHAMARHDESHGVLTVGSADCSLTVDNADLISKVGI